MNNGWNNGLIDGQVPRDDCRKTDNQHSKEFGSSMTANKSGGSAC